MLSDATSSPYFADPHVNKNWFQICSILTFTWGNDQFWRPPPRNFKKKPKKKSWKTRRSESLFWDSATTGMSMVLRITGWFHPYISRWNQAEINPLILTIREPITDPWVHPSNQTSKMFRHQCGFAVLFGILQDWCCWELRRFIPQGGPTKASYKLFSWLEIQK